MDQDTPERLDEPVWARPDSFPKSPDGRGWMDPKGGFHPVDSLDLLLKSIADDERGRVILVWSEAHAHLVLPEELDAADTAVHDARCRRIAQLALSTQRRLYWGSAILLAVILQQIGTRWESLALGDGLVAVLGGMLSLFFDSIPVGIGILLWAAMVFIPWYQDRKEDRLWNGKQAGDSKLLIPTLRFETWLSLQRAPVTRVLAGAMILIWCGQLWVGEMGEAYLMRAIALDKQAYHSGEYWRLLTAPWLHGNFVHFMLNLLALLYLGKRVELFARWPHLLNVLLFACIGGGLFSVQFTEKSSIGISGGLMGWLGFLLVFESLHRRLVTRSARRRLLVGVILTAAMGLVGHQVIDNAAHLGGLLAGMVYAGIVFPLSASVRRPKVLGIDRFAGFFAAAILTATVVLALSLMWWI